MPTTMPDIMQETEGYNSERKKKESDKTVVSGKSRNGEGRASAGVLLYYQKTLYIPGSLNQKKVAMLDPSLFWGREFMYVVGFGENEEA